MGFGNKVIGSEEMPIFCIILSVQETNLLVPCHSNIIRKLEHLPVEILLEWENYGLFFLYSMRIVLGI